LIGYPGTWSKFEMSAYFRRHLPQHAIVEEPAGFGHSPHLDDPARLGDRLLAFAKASAVIAK
jgi:pimeloyl-ACP methyl ester carboxylesterase